MAVDVNCTLNELETVVRTAPAHRSFSRVTGQIIPPAQFIPGVKIA